MVRNQLPAWVANKKEKKKKKKRKESPSEPTYVPIFFRVTLSSNDSFKNRLTDLETIKIFPVHSEVEKRDKLKDVLVYDHRDRRKEKGRLVQSVVSTGIPPLEFLGTCHRHVTRD